MPTLSEVATSCDLIHCHLDRPHTSILLPIATDLTDFILTTFPHESHSTCCPQLCFMQPLIFPLQLQFYCMLDLVFLRCKLGLTWLLYLDIWVTQ